MQNNIDKSSSIKSPSEGGGFRGRPIFDIIGIGIGPFNLGLAALCHTMLELNCLFIDQNGSFNWHPGMMIPGTRLQVPYYADLVTLADPTSDFSYFNFLHNKQRMIRFAVRENYFILRSRYNEYCQWVAAQLPSLQFNQRCTTLQKEEGYYKVITNRGSFLAKHIVIGTGTVPYLPSFADIKHPLLFHSADYLFRKEKLLQQKRITIIGSGQSAAEIFYDLLQYYSGELYWFTRSDSLFPMDVSKFSIEKTSPDYIDHFYSLPTDVKPQVLSRQNHLFKGINAELIGAIYDWLDDNKPAHAYIHPNCCLQHINGEFDLYFLHTELQQFFKLATNAVVLATGYHAIIPSFIKPIKEHIQWTEKEQYKVNRNYSIDKNNQIFVQNADLHTHGFNAADLGMGPHRNAVILNSILGYEHYKTERNTSFQCYGLPIHCQKVKELS